MGDVFITTTGNRDVIVEGHFEGMPDGALLATAGHFDVEVGLDALSDLAIAEREVRDGEVVWEKRFEGEKADRVETLAPPSDDGIDLPSLPSWVGPPVAGTAIGALGAGIASRFREE